MIHTFSCNKVHACNTRVQLITIFWQQLSSHYSWALVPKFKLFKLSSDARFYAYPPYFTKKERRALHIDNLDAELYILENSRQDLKAFFTCIISSSWISMKYTVEWGDHNAQVLEHPSFL
ncbi:hypothetical protein K1T71_003738 [Dendrolimus kikuchii]|uniref:Uncharacterized protein n=1 Tax=Dendrolimus kikuchii TaxID=765133 RepID=A0ACC1D8N7_9NEOP|nr:hypothetical protein K1T71_003738 [Dendrolimus kikuchii]